MPFIQIASPKLLFVCTAMNRTGLPYPLYIIMQGFIQRGGRPGIPAPQPHFPLPEILKFSMIRTLLQPLQLLLPPQQKILYETLLCIKFLPQ